MRPIRSWSRSRRQAMPIHPGCPAPVPDVVHRFPRPFCRSRRHDRLRPPGQPRPRRERPSHSRTAGCSPAWTPWSTSWSTATGSRCCRRPAGRRRGPGRRPEPPGSRVPPPLVRRHSPVAQAWGRRTRRGGAAAGGGRGVGLLRVRGDRLEATSLRHAWAQIDEGLRAGLTFAAWCHGVPWPDCGPRRFSVMENDRSSAGSLPGSSTEPSARPFVAG
jgi:hypothetical protein